MSPCPFCRTATDGCAVTSPKTGKTYDVIACSECAVGALKLRIAIEIALKEQPKAELRSAHGFESEGAVEE